MNLNKKSDEFGLARIIIAFLIPETDGNQIFGRYWAEHTMRMSELRDSALKKNPQFCSLLKISVNRRASKPKPFYQKINKKSAVF